MVIAFAGGVTALRQTKAIWTMDSPNAVAINNTLNTVTGLEPLLIVIVVILLILVCVPVRLGFR